MVRMAGDYSERMSCVCCNDVRGAGEVVEENAHAWVVRHPQGQTMIVAKRHVENVSDLEEEEWLAIARTWHRAERALNAERVIVLKLGVATPHLHIHLHPFPRTATRQEIFLTLESR
jgi:diadenosine tetraphosphate (Ap4A) HIT family hydrolase